MAIYKMHIALTVMLEADSEAEACSLITNSTLDAVAYAIDEGEWIGMSKLEESEEVTPGNLHDELLAIGNDGTFFSELPAKQE